MEQKTHWKKLVNPNYLGSYSLNPGEEVVYTIKEIKREKVKGPDGKEEECSVCYFMEQGVKPMIMNIVNSKIVSKMYQTPYIEDWPGKKIQIYSAKVKAFGDVVDALRIRPQIPNQSLPVLPESGKHYDACVTHLAKGGPMDDLKKHYTISDELSIKLKQDAGIK